MTTVLAVERAAAEMERRNVPGVSIAFIADGEVASLAQLGVRSLETGVPVDKGTIFEGASHGKPVFAYAVLKLAEQGVVALDEPIGGELDEVDLTRITPAHILSHTSGIGNWWIGKDPPVLTGSAPGESFAYSSTAYVVLQHVVERLSERALEDLMYEIMYAPFGLRDTSYLWRDDFDSRVAQGHDGEGAALEKWKPKTLAISASGVHTTARDLGVCLVSATARNSVTERMLTPRVRVAQEWDGVVPGDTAWGLGWGLTPVDGDVHLWHWGMNPGFTSFSTASRAHRNGVVILTNSDNGLWVCRAVVTELLGAEHPAFPWLGHG